MYSYGIRLAIRFGRLISLESGGTGIITSLGNPDYFKIVDDKTEEYFYGCNQEWYTVRWRRMSGCGPSVVANIMHYLGCVSSVGAAALTPFKKSDCVRLMDDVWQYVTPTPRGIPNTGILNDGVLAYAKAKELDLIVGCFNVPKHAGQRPEIGKMLSFVHSAMAADAPVAFLNLDNGEEPLLDSWHWVTVIRLESGEDGSAFAEILDEGVIKKVDLALWYRTTKQSGGFVSIGLRQDKEKE